MKIKVNLIVIQEIDLRPYENKCTAQVIKERETNIIRQSVETMLNKPAPFAPIVSVIDSQLNVV
jgi:hypothetical protein